MSRRRKYGRDNELERSLAGIFTLALLALIWYLFTNPAKSIAYILAVLICVFLFIFLRKWLRKKHFNSLLDKLKSSGQEDYLKNFINSFGLEGRRGEGYAFRNHKFEWDRINDLKKILREKEVTSNEKDVFALLRFYIQEKEEKFTREFIRKEPQKLANLTGSDFEKSIMETGNEVEQIARKLFPIGILIERRDAKGQQATQDYLRKKQEVLFQPIFVKNGYLAAIDILKFEPETNSYSVYEVKSTNDIDKKIHYHDFWVLGG